MMPAQTSGMVLTKARSTTETPMTTKMSWRVASESSMSVINVMPKAEQQLHDKSLKATARA